MDKMSKRREKRYDRNRGRSKGDPVLSETIGENGAGRLKYRYLHPTKGWKYRSV